MCNLATTGAQDESEGIVCAAMYCLRDELFVWWASGAPGTSLKDSSSKT